MKVHVECACGRRHKVAAGNTECVIRCEGCGRTVRIPPSLVGMVSVSVPSACEANQRAVTVVLMAALGAIIVAAVSLSFTSGDAPQRSPVAESDDGIRIRTPRPIIDPSPTLPLPTNTEEYQPVVPNPPVTDAQATQHVAPVLRDMRGVQVTKDRRTGVTKLIVDPFPDDPVTSQPATPAKTRPPVNSAPSRAKTQTGKKQ